MTTKTVSVHSPSWLPITGDKKELSLRYEIVDNKYVGKPEEGSKTFHGKMIIGISGTLVGTWGLEGLRLEIALVEYSKQYIRDKLRENALREEEELQLSSYNAPPKCPFDLSRIDYYKVSSFQVDIPSKITAETNSDNIPGKIISLRDNINSLFGEKYGGRLLALPQERSLSELSKPCRNEEEFAYRVASLGVLITAIDTNNFKLSMEDEQLKGSIDKFGAFLRNQFPNMNTSEIMETLASFNRLRRMYPIHTDRASGVIKSFRFFSIKYPVQDYQKAWEQLIRNYLQLLISILELLRDRSAPNPA